MKIQNVKYEKTISGKLVPIMVTILPSFDGSFKVNGIVVNKLSCPVYKDKNFYYFVINGQKILLQGTDFTSLKHVPWDVI